VKQPRYLNQCGAGQVTEVLVATAINLILFWVRALPLKIKA